MLDSLFPLAHARYSSLPILGGILDKLCNWLQSRGYPPDAIRRRIVGAPLLEESLRRRRVRSLHTCTVSVFKSCLPRTKRWTAQLAHALGRSLLEYFKEFGGLAFTPPNSTEQLVGAYQDHLERAHGLAHVTIQRHSKIVVEFLRFLKYGDQPQSLRRLQVSEIDAYLSEAGHRRGRVTMQHVTARLRVFLRFLAVEGMAPTGLDAYVESPRRYRGERLPRALSWKDVRSLLRAIDRSTLKGIRDYAMLLLIATYGLRISEVAGLEIDDIAWRDRRICVSRPKVGTPLLLPLTDEVATALLDYLRQARPDTELRQLFLRLRVPGGPILPGTVTDVFQAWAAHAGVRLPHLAGPHCLRHSVAMHLLRHGSPLKTIGDLLGHRSAESTCVYLRLNIDDLRDVALPLPKPIVKGVDQ